MVARGLIPALLVCLALAGCGGAGASDAAAVKRTVHQLLADLATANGRGFCALISPAERGRLGSIGPRHSCSETMTALAAELPAPRRAALLHAEVRAVTIRGSTAIVRAADITTTRGTLAGLLSDSEGPTRLQRRPDGSWQFSG